MTDGPAPKSFGRITIHKLIGVGGLWEKIWTECNNPEVEPGSCRQGEDPHLVVIPEAALREAEAERDGARGAFVALQKDFAAAQAKIERLKARLEQALDPTWPKHDSALEPDAGDG